ncbi:transglutaminase domain-containing protein [Pimelobacter simplex]|uniref:transglutaminase domain-containing protein n=1 Tax=Nocardioides simplex TaxID=2045 RepID=UPI00382D21AA
MTQRRFPWLAVLGSLALVVILVVGLVVVLTQGGDDDPEDDRRSETGALRDRLLNEGRAELPTTAKVENAVPGYDYTEALTGVGTEADLTLSASYDDPDKIQVYADAALTKPVPALVLPDPTASSSEPRLAVKPVEVRRGHITRQNGQASATVADLGTYWNLNPEVYVVQQLNPDGSKRARPLVTEVSFVAETPSPAQVAATVSAQGDALLEWSPVEGATEYAVVLQQRRGSNLDGTVRVIGRTTETTWSSEETAVCRTVSCTQNEALRLTTVDASTMASNPTLVGEKIDARLGVIAVVDRKPSALAPVDLTGLETLPVRSDRKWDGGADIWNRGLESLPSRFLFASVDGSTRATGASIDRTQVRRKGRYWEVPLQGEGTRLVETVRIPADAVKDVDAEVAAFNARAKRDYPKAGLLRSSVVIDVDDPKQPSPELPVPSYPVFGSNELSKFIAGQLIAGATDIDLSEFDDQPGLPDLQDAWREAVYQNPYALAYFDGYSFDGSVLHVQAAYTAAEKQRRQQKIADRAKAIVKSEITAGMSVADKVSALNRYLVDQGEYDDAAISGSPGKYRSDIPAQLRYAWEPDGILLSGTGVCMSYAYAFDVLAEEAGIESVVVTGDLADGGAHAWNKVRIGNSWRAVDVTWNDPEGRWTSPRGDRYLMIRDAQFTGNALRSEDEDWMSDAYLRDYATR